jgi:hypothetical protein
MQDKMTDNSLATASDLMNLKDNTPPETHALVSTLAQRSVFDMSLGILAMNICGNLYSCFDYLSSEATGLGSKFKLLHPKPFEMQHDALFCQF